MSSVDGRVVFLPRYTTLVGDGDFSTAPLDVSRQGGAQFQVWRGPIRVSSGDPTFTLYLEESLDAEKWVLGPSTPKGIPVAIDETRFFSYSFRLRWFRLRVEVDGNDPMVTCWAEGLLRAGDGGVWARPGLPVPHGVAQERFVPEDADKVWAGLINMQKQFKDWYVKGVKAGHDTMGTGESWQNQLNMWAQMFDHTKSLIEAQYYEEHGLAPPPPPVPVGKKGPGAPGLFGLTGWTNPATLDPADLASMIYWM